MGCTDKNRKSVTMDLSDFKSFWTKVAAVLLSDRAVASQNLAVLQEDRFANRSNLSRCNYQSPIPACGTLLTQGVI